MEMVFNSQYSTRAERHVVVHIVEMHVCLVKATLRSHFVFHSKMATSRVCVYLSTYVFVCESTFVLLFPISLVISVLLIVEM